MKIAVCSLSEFTYVSEFIDATEALKERHELCYFLGFSCFKSIQLLKSRQISYQILLDESVSINSLLIKPEHLIWSNKELFSEYFIKHAQIILPLLIKSLRQWNPDLILSHLRDYSGITAAEILNKPIISFGSHTSPVRIENIDPPFGAGISSQSSEKIIRFMWKLHHQFNQEIDFIYNQKLRQPYGLKSIQNSTTIHSQKQIFLSLISPLSNKKSPEPDYVKYVGSLFSKNKIRPSLEEQKTGDRLEKASQPKVFICLGTTYIKSLLKKCLVSLESFEGTIIVSLGGNNNLKLPSLSTRKNIIYYPFFEDVNRIYQLSDVIITVSGGKTVLDVLSQGKPLICLPQQGEQQEIALALQDYGAAKVLPNKNWRSQKFISLIKEVLENSEYLETALKLKKLINSNNGVKEVTDTINKFL